MLEQAHEYGGDYYISLKRTEMAKKGFRSTDLLGKGHGVHRLSGTYRKGQFFLYKS
jgi:hypothetical protein